MGDYQPMYQDAEQFTYTAGAAITGGQVLEVSGDNTVQPAGAASVKAIGVAAHDATSGQRVSIYPLDLIHETITGTGGLTAGQQVQCGAAGTVVALGATPPVGQNIGVCTVGGTVGNKARWKGIN